MKIKSLSYAQHERTPREWRIADCTFGNLNLIVGENASGKSRTLNVIRGLAHLVSGYRKLTFQSGDYDIVFNSSVDPYNYRLHCEDNKILAESLHVGGESLLERGVGGKGKIFAEKLEENGALMDFQTPETELACVARRDEIQHTFFQPLHDWGATLRHYHFGSNLGQASYLIHVEDSDLGPPDTRDENRVVHIFMRGREIYGSEFSERVLAGMAEIGYQIERISAEVSKQIEVAPLGQHPYWLSVKEQDLPGETSQMDMSQGMFRCLSLIIQLVYSLMANEATCVLVDDIGEGLDFERASALIKYVLASAEKSNIQLIMATNDRFVMNSVPLECWMIARRMRNCVNYLSVRNAPKVFQRFKETGLSNFDMFASRFYEGSEESECGE